jgi:alanine racemase
MNITSVDVSGAPGTKIGDETVIVSDDSRAPNSMEALAKRMGTITYEVAVKIPAHLKRIIV